MLAVEDALPLHDVGFVAEVSEQGEFDFFLFASERIETLSDVNGQRWSEGINIGQAVMVFDRFDDLIRKSPEDKKISANFGVSATEAAAFGLFEGHA